MKYTKYVLLLLIIAISSCKNEPQQIGEDNTIKVFGTLKGLDVPYIFIDYTHEITGDRVWDTVYVQNEHFLYTTEIKNTKRIAIWPLLERKDKKASSGKNERIEFLVKPGDVIEFKGNVTETFNAVPTGNSLSNDMNSFNKSVEHLSKKSAEIMGRMRALQIKLMNDKSFDPTKGMPASLAIDSDSLKIIGDEINIVKKQFIKDNPKSEVSAFYLSNMVRLKYLDDDEALNLLESFDNSVKTSPFYIEVATRLKGSEATKAGSLVPELVTNRTLDGKQFDLKSLRGKYVVIDFWGTWCGPCVAEMPTVKEYSEKYKDKLVIVGVNSGDTKQKIEDFVSSKGYEWIQLMSKKGVNDDNFVSKFNISGFPTKFIIDPDGIIVEKYIGGSEDAFIKLDELLNKLKI